MNLRRPLTRALGLALVLFSGGAANAALDSIDNEPAATLLIPYFAVDVSDEACADPSFGQTTLFSVGNMSPASVVAHVQLWTDWSVPWADFNVFLTGYDIQTVNLRDYLCNGMRPTTGLGSGNSSVGAFSNDGPNFEDTCNQTMTPGDGPFYEALSAMVIDQNKAAFTGQAIPGTGDCAGSGQSGPNVAIGYITVDVVNQCSIQVPTVPGYFDAIGGFDNVLVGDFFLADPANNFSQGFNAVQLQAGSTGPHTFYGRYVLANGEAPALDGREPLPTTLGTRFVEGGGFDETTHFVWREAGPSVRSVACGDRPDWFPLGQSNDSGGGAVVVFDEEENPVVPMQAYFPNAVNVVRVGNTLGGDVQPKLDTGGLPFGWVLYNLQSAATLPTYGDTAAQAYVLSAIRALGRFSVGLHPFVFDNANDPVQTNPGL